MGNDDNLTCERRDVVTGCPFRGLFDAGNCPAFAGRCPFANVGANNTMLDDLKAVLDSMPKGHTDPAARNALPPKFLAVVRSLQEKIRLLAPPAKYVTKLTTGKLLLERMEHMHRTKDLRSISAPMTFTSGRSSFDVAFTSRIIASESSEKHCIPYIVALLRLYAAIEDGLGVTSDGRVRTLHKPRLSRKELLKLELAYFFKIETGLVDDYINMYYPPSNMLQDFVKRIKHLLVVNPVLMISYMYVLYCGAMHAHEFRKGMRVCAPHVSRIYCFQDLDEAPSAVQYQLDIDTLGLSPEESDEIILELKYVYRMQKALFHEFDRLLETVPRQDTIQQEKSRVLASSLLYMPRSGSEELFQEDGSQVFDSIARVFFAALTAMAAFYLFDVKGAMVVAGA